MARRFLRTRVARRVLSTFLLGALLPVGIVAGLSYEAVTGQLEDQSREQLDQLAKAAGMSVIERLWYARGLLTQMVYLDALGHRDGALPPILEGAVMLRDGEPALVVGEVGPLPSAPAEGAGEATAALRVAAGGEPPDLLLSVPGRGAGEVVWGRVEGDSVWSRAFASATLPTTAGVCVQDSGGRPLACGLEAGDGLARALEEAGGAVAPGELTVSGARHLISTWEIYLPASFGAAPWTMVVSEAREDVFAPMATFSRSFPVALALGLAVVALMANIQIRRTMEPLNRLTAGTRRVAEGDLATPVIVDSGDEFGELADSFNDMAAQIADQFRFLDVGRVIDETSLSRLDREAIVTALTAGCGELTPGRRVAVLGVDGADAWRWADERACSSTSVAVRGRDGRVKVVPGRDLLPREPGVRVGPNDEAFDALGAYGFSEADGVVELFPLRFRDEVMGALALGSFAGRGLSEVERAKIRSLSARAALGLQGAGLVEELEELAWGTLRALARAIDAKSHWTAGHSERVTALSLALAREMGLPQDQIALLERGGLLHDVGKIGVPARILDHPGPLTDEQFAVMKQHPVIGVRILEPIQAFRSALPIVRSHHERWDGTGYPDGLRGREIPWLARILAVADVFDAMVSTRPYREAIPEEVVAASIRDRAGLHFDPEVVEAFVRVVEQGWDHGTGTHLEVNHAV